MWQVIQGWSLGRMVTVLFGTDSSLALNIAAARYCTLSSMFELCSISFSRSLSDSRVRCLSKRGWTGGGDTGIRGRETGVKGAEYGGRGGGGRGKRGRGTGVEGAGVGKFWGRGLYQSLLYFIDFYVLQCNSWVSEVYNRRIKVNSGIFTMNPALISLHRRVVFRQP